MKINSYVQCLTFCLYRRSIGVIVFYTTNHREGAYTVAASTYQRFVTFLSMQMSHCDIACYPHKLYIDIITSYGSNAYDLSSHTQTHCLLCDVSTPTSFKCLWFPLARQFQFRCIHGTNCNCEGGFMWGSCDPMKESYFMICLIYNNTKNKYVESSLCSIVI